MTQEDEILRQALEYICAGWPTNRKMISSDLHELYNNKKEFSIYERMLIKSNRFVILTSMWNEILEAIHNGYQGITKCYNGQESIGT